MAQKNKKESAMPILFPSQVPKLSLHAHANIGETCMYLEITNQDDLFERKKKNQMNKRRERSVAAGQKETRALVCWE